MLLHAGASVAPHDLASAWTLDPVLLASLALPTALYWAGARAMPAFARRRRRWFAAGIAALVLALVSPFDALGDTLFSAHMVQHMLLIVVAAPLLVMGDAFPVMVRGLPRGWRRGIARAARRGGWLRAAARGLTAPVVALALHLAALWAWHIPGPYELALTHRGVHVAEHVSFVTTALMFWWVVLRPVRHPGRGGEMAAVSLAFITIVQCGILGALITFASHPWYPAHGPGARAWGITLLEDQQLAGLIMWVPAGIPYLWAALVVLGRRLQRRDAELAAA